MTGRIVYTGGTFDLFHVGHVHLLRQCRELAGREGAVVVALNSDAFVQAYKHLTPTHDYASRRTIVSACEFVDLVVRNVGDADSTRALEVIEPDVIAIGTDWFDADLSDPWARYRAQMGFTASWQLDRGIELVALELLPLWSASRVRRELGGAL